MRLPSKVVVIILFLMSLSAALPAEKNQFGVADTRRISFAAPVRVGDVLLPKGEYEVRHTMQGEEHIMVFQQLRSNHPAQAHVRCTLVPLQKKADQNTKIYTPNAAREQVLRELVFRGDLARHVF